MENIILTIGDYVDLLINGQVIGLGVGTFHTPGSRGRNIQATRCVLGGKS